MKLPTLDQLIYSGTYSVLASYDKDPSKACVKLWLAHPDIHDAAFLDAQKRLAWGQKHGSLDNCELPHNNLIKVISKMIEPMGVE